MTAYAVGDSEMKRIVDKIYVPVSVMRIFTGKQKRRRAFEKGRSSVLLRTKKKSRRLSGKPAIRFPDVVTTNDYALIIRKAENFVNSKSKRYL